MRKFSIKILLIFGIISISNAQNKSIVKGTVSDGEVLTEISKATVKIKGAIMHTLTKENGKFEFENVPEGSYTLIVTKPNYKTKNVPITVKNNKTVDLGVIFLYKKITETEDLSTISLSDDELLDDEDGGSDNVSGLLVSSKDAFLRAAAFNFGQAWFRVRGYDSENGVVMLNGIAMNKMYGGRPQWSNWGGLNDATRNQELTNGLAPSNHIFGGALGTTNIITKASEYRPGTRVTASATNRNYIGRFMVTHSSGLRNKFAYTISASRRMASEGYHKGTFYDANSFFAAIEFKPNDAHSLNLTAIYAPNRRGKSSPNTQEVYDLKETKYNAYWGYQDGKRRNSRIKEVEEPIIMLSHEWNASEKTQLNTSLAYQFGKISNSRLGYFNAPNPDPTYYRYLPSYQMRDFSLNPEYAEKVATLFKTNEDYSQIKWENLYRVNQEYNGSARYYLYEDRNDDKQFMLNSVLTHEVGENLTLNLGASYKNLVSENYAKMLDLLGANHFVDVNQYNPGNIDERGALSNVNGNPIINKNDKFQYNYRLNGREYNIFAQLQFSFNKLDAYISGNTQKTEYRRVGLFKNELYLDNSFCKGEKLNFFNGSVKAGLTYKLSGRHLFNLNAGYISKAPTLRNTYPNARVNHDVTKNIKSEIIKTIDASYIFRAPSVKARLTGYYTTFSNAIDINRYFNQSLGDFIAEVNIGIEKLHFGGELGVEYQITPTLKAIAVAAIGQYTYANNPLSYYTSDELFLEDAKPTKTYLRNYKLPGTPQRATSFGLEYRNPKYWWVGANINHLSHTYIDIASGLRTDQFYINKDTNQPFDGVTQKDVDNILKQERFKDYMLLNIIGGKSWRFGNKYLGLFASVNNVLNTKYKTGGFEQGRNGNYKLLSEDQARKTPLYGSKYWYGYGRTFYLNLNFSF